MLSSCSIRKYTLITDEYWNAVLQEELKTGNQTLYSLIFKDSLRLEGKRIRIHTVQTDGRGYKTDDILSAAGNAGSDYIILSPMLSGYAEALTEKLPESVIMAAAVSKENENSIGSGRRVIYFPFDYSGAFFECGKYAASLNLETAAVIYTGNSDYNYFLEGWRTLRDIAELEVTEFSNPDVIGIDEITGFAEDVVTEKELVAVFAGPQTGEYLAELSSSKLRIITENIIPWSKSGLKVTASVEMPVMKVLSEIVNITATDDYADSNYVEADFFSYQE